MKQMNAKDIALKLIKDKKQAEIDEAKAKKSNQRYRREKEREWIDKISEIVNVFEDDFKIVFTETKSKLDTYGSWKWEIFNKKKSVVLIVLKYHYHEGYDDPDEGWHSSYTTIAVEISKDITPNRQNKYVSEVNVYYTSHFEKLETEFVEKLGKVMSEYC